MSSRLTKISLPTLALKRGAGSRGVGVGVRERWRGGADVTGYLSRGRAARMEAPVARIDSVVIDAGVAPTHQSENDDRIVEHDSTE
jgi:hypothetical protein